MNRFALTALSLTLLSAFACSDTDGDADSTIGVGGAVDGGVGEGSAPSGGAANTGGLASGGMASGGAAIGGSNSSGGSQVEGGADSGGSENSGGMSDGGESSGGSGSGGETEMGSGGESDGGDDAVDPSAGCGSAAPGLGSAGSPLSIGQNQYYVVLPTNYDQDTPYRMIFMFNPTGNPIEWSEQNSGFKETGAKDEAIMVYPHPMNSSSGWGAGDVPFFEKAYDEMVGNFCVDKARVFAAGESSGGDYSSILGCEFGDKLRAVGPCATKSVGQYPLNVSQRECVGDVSPIVIHGKNDNVVGPENGPLTRDFYLELNGCSTESVPVEGYTDTLSNCVQYEGCNDGYPVIWCQHTDPEYGNTNHGWPKFAGKMLWEQFSSY